MSLSLGLGLGLTRNKGGGRNPKAFLGTDLIAWWTAEASSLTLAGASVSAWADQVAGYSATQAASDQQFVYSATSFGGYPGLTADGINDQMTCVDAALLAALPAGSVGCEVWVIADQLALAADGAARMFASYGTANNTARRVARLTDTGVNRANVNVGTGGTTVSRNDTTTDLFGRHLVRYVYTPTGVALAVDGNALSAETAAVPATLKSRLRLGAGASSSPAGFAQAVYSDVLFTKPLNSAQVAQMNAWALPRRRV